MKVFVNGGASIVGSRIVRTLPSVINCDLVLGARNADPGELSKFERSYPTVLPDQAYESRSALARRRGMNVVGRLSEVDFSNFDVVIDTLSAHEHVDKYRSCETPFIVQGGGEWNGDFFASIPGRSMRVLGELKQLCAGETAAGVFIGALLSCWDASTVARINIHEWTMNKETQNNLESVFPELEGKLNVTRHAAEGEFVMLEIEVVLTDACAKSAIVPLRAALSEYERCVYIDTVERDVDRLKLAVRGASLRAHVENADALLPVFMIDEPRGQMFCARAIVPWKSVTVPSLLDYVGMMTYSGLTCSQIVSHVNRSASWFGHTIVALKQILTKEITGILDR